MFNKIFFALVLVLSLSGSCYGQVVSEGEVGVKWDGEKVFYPYGVFDPEVKVTSDRFVSIELQPGERILDHSRDTRLFFRYDNSLNNGVLQYRIKVKPRYDGITAYFFIETNKRKYNITLDAVEDGTMMKGRERAFPRLIAFYYPVDSKFPEGDKAVRDSQVQLDKVASNISSQLNYSFEEGDHGFPWEPTRIFEDEGVIYIEAPNVINNEGLPTLYSIDSEGNRSLIDYDFLPDSNTLKASDGFVNGVLTYEFDHPGVLGLYTVTSEKQLFLTKTTN